MALLCAERRLHTFAHRLTSSVRSQTMDQSQPRLPLSCLRERGLGVRAGHPAIVLDVNEQQTSLPDNDAPRRRPGEPHPYMLQRNPPNLWILVVMTIFSLLMALLVLAVTIVL